MIGYLRGRPIFYQDFVMIVTNGVGYKVYVGDRTMAGLNKNLGLNKTLDKDSDKIEVELFIFTYVKEDRLDLYGFASQEQLRLFELLLDVSGVGPKTALPIVDRDPEQIVDAVQNARVEFFKSVPRIGKKTAQKIILDLKSQLGSLKELSLGPRSDQERDVYETLAALGYEESDIAGVVAELDLENMSVEEAVKQALKLFSA